MAIASILVSCNSFDMPQTRNTLPAEVPEVASGSELTAARTAFETGNFGFAARYYQMAMTAQPESAEACLGLAASYDWLYRFDLADPVYRDCREIAGDSFHYHNNVGFSQLLRGEFGRASVSFAQAKAMRPGHPVIETNLQILRDVGDG